MDSIFLDMAEKDAIIRKQLIGHAKTIPHKDQPSAELEVGIIAERIPSLILGKVVRRVNIDHLHLAGETLFQRV